MRVLLDRKNPLVPEPDLEIDQLLMIPETPADHRVLEELLERFEVSGLGRNPLPNNAIFHLSIKIERKESQ